MAGEDSLSGLLGLFGDIDAPYRLVKLFKPSLFPKHTTDR
jgi:hypothetical protein